MTAFDKFEKFGQKIYNGQDVLKNHILNKYPIHITDNTEDYSQIDSYDSEFVWLVDRNIETLRSFPWWFKPVADQKDSIHLFPYVYKASKRIKSWHKVKLVPTKNRKEKFVNHNHICGVYDVYNGREEFDLFFLGSNQELFESIKTRFPRLEAVSSYKEAKEKSKTNMFWLVPDDIIVSDFFKFSYQPDDWSQDFTHVFANGKADIRDGIALFPKHYEPTDKELLHRYYVNKKELKIIASKPLPYQQYSFKSYQEYLSALENSPTDLFWYVPDDVDVAEDFKFDLYFEHQNQYDRTINHVFLNGKNYDGITLFSKHAPVTEKEFAHRFYTNKKEWEVVASCPKKFEQFVINNYADYKLALERSSMEMFWGIPADVEVDKNFKFDLYFSHHNSYDRNITHVFKNNKTYDGVVLFSKNVKLNEREVNFRFYSQKKEWDIVASVPRPYDVFEIDSYDDYIKAIDTSSTDLFWASSKNIKIFDYENLDNFYISHHDIVDRKQNHVFYHTANDNLYRNGLMLLSKYKQLTKREVEHRFPVNRKEWDLIMSGPVEYDQFTVETYDDYLSALENSKTELFWATSNNIDYKIPNIYFSHDNEYDRKNNHAFEHHVNGKVMFNGLFLFSKHKPVTEREIKYRHIIDVKEWTEFGSQKTTYDIFEIDSYEEYQHALKESQTEMFWGTSRNIDSNKFEFDLYFSHDNEYDRTTNHAFIHRVNDKDYLNGVFLFSKHAPVTEREIQHRFIVNAKEWDIVASGPIQYDIWDIDSYEEYIDALEHADTEMFWAVSRNINTDDFDFDLYFTHDNEYDRTINHCFAHLVGEEKYYNGLMLLSKHSILTEQEIKHRFPVHRKEWDIVASKPVQYDFYVIDSYKEYQNAMEDHGTEMFWMSSSNINLDPNFDLSSIYFTHDNEYDRTINHSFIHRVDDKDYRNGLFLCSRHRHLSEKEIENRFLVNAKEWDIVASGAKAYDVFEIDGYNQYLRALRMSGTEMFWGVSANLSYSLPDLYFTHDNTYDRNTNHSFLHCDNKRNGVFLFSKNAQVSEREIEHRHLVNAKEWDIVASNAIEYERFFIETYEDYLEALEKSKTEMFWALSPNVDFSEFDFNLYFTHDNEYDRKTNHAFLHCEDKFNGIFLLSKHAPITQKEVEHRHIVNAKEWRDRKTKAVKYDVFEIDSYDEYLTALEQSKTEMFWMSSRNITADIPNLYFTHDNTYDRFVSHNFLHCGKRNGLFLLSKRVPVTEREIKYRHLINAKEWNIEGSTSKPYDVFEIDSYDEYLSALKNTTTEMFWMSSRNITANIPNIYFTHDNEYDRNINHNFLHCGDKRNGLFLCSMHRPLTEREVEHRFIVDAKEWDIEASGPKEYNYFDVDSYDEYLDALEKSSTEMFWVGSKNIEPIIPNVYFTHDNEFDRSINHAFLHCGKYNGLFLCSKKKPLTLKEVQHRHIVNAKEWNIEGSTSKPYDVFEIDSYDEYLAALNNTTTEMFWMSSKNLIPNLPDLYFTHDNEYDRKHNHNFLHCDKRNGVFLCSIHVPVTQREIEHRFFVDAKEWDIEASIAKPYDVFEIDSYDEYLTALEYTTTEMFWMSSRNISATIPDLYFTHDNEYDRTTNHSFIHRVDGKDYRNGLFLCSKHRPLTEKEVEHRFIVDAKEWDTVASGPIKYQVFNIETYNDYLIALENTTTEMFWGVSSNVKYLLPDLYFTHDNTHDRNTNHNFLHCGKRNGVFLFSKHSPVTEREIEHRHLINAKEWNIVASEAVIYDKFKIDSYDEYLSALEQSKTEMFWGIPSDIIVDYNFDLYFTHDNIYDRKTNHIMLNGDHRDGIVLFSKHNPVTEKEVENRFYINKKDWDIVASQPKRYDFFNVETYDEYLDALENSSTDMFWASTKNIKLDEKFDLDLYFNHHNTYDRRINHAFVHRANGEDHYNGLFLLSKHAQLTQREIEHRLVTKRKEWDIVASGPVEYNKFVIDNYDDYERAVQESTTEMFWMIPPEVTVDPNFKFDLYFTHNKWFERETNHVFKNGDAWDGISLVSKKSHITEREINMRFLANKKQYDIVASTPALYDIVFISKDEEHADENYKKLLKRFSKAKRIHGVKGIHQAHIEAAKLCDTEMFWVVDADAEIIDKFNFDYYVPAYDPDGRKTVHVWKAQNPINSLVYGYGAVKLLPRELTLNMDTTKPDMTTSISQYFKSVNRISNITRFNTDEFSTWRSAFRECVKLASRSIDGQLDEETEFRLKIWCTRGKDKPFGEYCIAGANAGKLYGENNRGDIQALARINDFDWLQEQFKQSNR